MKCSYTENELKTGARGQLQFYWEAKHWIVKKKNQYFTVHYTAINSNSNHKI